ncbi:NAD-dependent protein deacetylase [Propionicicella superfundia]|uniref:NAD-dependent protein deacetylase n=1 Tax=Propionicicella superfundia TaxID=348582 RepID=UPI0003F75411|nr:NAD-dependent protein deacetylase [Propionicicella superfundia]
MPVSISDLTSLLRDARWVALTGAGISTDSGIPDYRGPHARPTKPLMFQEFLSSEAHRRRYWARAMVGWTTIGSAQPNAGHRALAGLTDRRLRGIITQNVDGLHQAAGSDGVVELHGTLAQVRCLSCGAIVARESMLEALEDANPGWRDRLPQPPDSPDYRTPERLRPDGDAEVTDWQWVRLVSCGVCGGILKPDVVFFGESVPSPRVQLSYSMVDDADALVVAGSSLTVMSGLRFVRHAAKVGKPVAIINRGPTRADELAVVRLDAGTSEVLTALERSLV